MAEQTMTVSMNGMRYNLVKSYNKVVRRLREHIVDNLTERECEELHEVLDEDFEELRQNIGILLCVFGCTGKRKPDRHNQERIKLVRYSYKAQT